ncbi:XdhC family protein [Litorihabitans aurantiacus]|uniref:Xanthine dehydrogenase accessory factor n=1 Tax=Litorihabitans aurantiacus TaxID=1930061 RepID=A0AA37ULE1_9MICO|nr:XdhC/CoxI family protein [Litorihabitans aurantiacus]GMA30139.1 hypothetical protein GCM10025875_01310 [Litorihabitans aurantiacus]
MFALAPDLAPLLRSGHDVALVTVVAARGRGPLRVGDGMAVTAGARVVGALSGGCVEADAVLLGLDVLATGAARRATFVLDCGGTIDVLVHRVRGSGGADAVAIEALERAARGERAELALLRRGPRAGALVEPRCAAEDEDPLVLQHRRRPHLTILGAGRYAPALCRLAAAAGHTVTVVDPSALLATPARFPDATRVVVADLAAHLATRDGADEGAADAVVVLAHDDRVAVPALATALTTALARDGYVGATASRATAARRRTALRAAGVPGAAIARLRSPIGLDLGGEDETATALAIVAELAAVRHAASARPLREGRGPVRARSTGGHARIDQQRSGAVA